MPCADSISPMSDACHTDDFRGRGHCHPADGRHAGLQCPPQQGQAPCGTSGVSPNANGGDGYTPQCAEAESGNGSVPYLLGCISQLQAQSALYASTDDTDYYNDDQQFIARDEGELQGLTGPGC